MDNLHFSTIYLFTYLFIVYLFIYCLFICLFIYLFQILLNSGVQILDISFKHYYRGMFLK